MMHQLAVATVVLASIFVPPLLALFIGWQWGLAPGIVALVAVVLARVGCNLARREYDNRPQFTPPAPLRRNGRVRVE